jgi:hypothetical protein
MAQLDEDWKKFLDATEEDAEEVETVDAEDETEEIEGADNDDSAESDEDDEEETDEEDADDEEADPKKDKKAKKEKSDADTYKPRLKQFLNDDGSLNAKKIEEGYIESGKQAVKLNTRVEELTESEGKLRTDYSALLEAIKAKPDIAKALFGEEGAKKLASSQPLTAKKTEETNPLLKHIEAQMNNASEKDYNEFVKAHPEAVTDPEKARKIGSFMKLYGSNYRDEHNGEIPPMKEALEAAYKFHGWDLKVKKKEDVAIAAKKVASTRSSGNARRPATKKQAEMGEQFFAQKLGVKLKP